MNQNFVKEKVRTTCEVLKKYEKRTVFEIPSMKYIPCGYKSGQELPEVTEEWDTFHRHDRVHGRDRHFWFYTEVSVPEDQDGQEYVLELSTGHEGDWDATNPQAMLYLDGKLVMSYDINHREYVLKGGRTYKVMLYFYVGMIESYVDVLLDLKAVDLLVRDLYFDMQVPYEAADCYKESDYISIRILKALELTCNRLDFRVPYSEAFYDSVKNAKEFLKQEFYEKECGQSDAVVSYIGHTHIDVAWLWTLAQTREKVQRTFSTMLYLMDRYPEFIFFSSQPQLLKYLHEEAPELYEQVKERIKEGRFEMDGAMWLEADCNLSSGESLIRQIMHGKEFMREEFGVDSKTLWLPDVFGYSAAVPQILKKTGVDRFVTSKISWNESNTLPYDSFIWKGIDGSEVFTYFMTAQDLPEDGEPINHTTYTGTASPRQNLGTWKRYQQKEYNNEVLNTFGYGDGGGGTTFEMLEVRRRMEAGLPGQPKAVMSRADDFLDRVESRFRENAALLGRMPKWAGELYLEFHRGTYTSTAKNKKNNRTSEFLLENAETLSVIAEKMKGTAYPKDLYHRNWETVLLNQFHDIIPGSSIFEVYEDSDVDYQRVREEVGGAYETALKAVAGTETDGTLVVYNPNGFTVSDYIRTGDGQLVYAANVPAMGVKSFALSELLSYVDPSGMSASKEGLETPFYSIRFDESFRIISLYDKENDREVIEEGRKGNLLRAFENYPYAWDNWELSSYHLQKYWDVTEVVSAEPFMDGASAGVKIVYHYDQSTINQTIRVYKDSRRIDFETEADWHEDHQMLKALFPVTVQSTEASYEIQYGHVKRPTHRNTSWDQAKFEVCAQKWMDLGEDGYGVSLLNDCKYGHSCLENLMTISLIKTGTYPNPVSDIGHHAFTYALLPHSGSFKEAGTIEEAYKLNRKQVVSAGSCQDYSLAETNKKNVILECAKKADDGNGTIFRLYETWNRKDKVTVRFGFEAKEIILCDMLERPIRSLGAGKEVTLPIGGFEILTIRTVE